MTRRRLMCGKVNRHNLRIWDTSVIRLCFVPFLLAKSTDHFSLRCHLLSVSTTWTCCNCDECHHYRKIARTSFSNKTEPRHTSILTSMFTSVLIFPVVGFGILLTMTFFFLPWLPRSPDLTPCDFFLWGYIKDVYLPLMPRDLRQL